MFCIRRKVQVEVVKIESDDIANAISEEIAKCNINKLVIGASSNGGIFSSSYWMPRGQSLSARVSESCPKFCTVYVVSEGKLFSVHPPNVDTITGDSSRSINYSSSYTLNFKTEWDVPTMVLDMINRRTNSSDTNEGFSPVNINSELEQCRMEFKRAQVMYAEAQTEAVGRRFL